MQWAKELQFVIAGVNGKVVRMTIYRTIDKRLQNSCQETTAKIIEYLSFLLQCVTVTLLGASAYYLYSLLRMVEASINELFTEPPELDVKRQKLIRSSSASYPEKASSIWERLTPKNASTNLVPKKWISSSASMKQSFWDRW